jgi:uncharacterized protein HemX
MDNSSLQIILTVIGVLGSGAAWKYFEARLKTKSQEKKDELENSDSVQYRDDLKHRVRNLETLLSQNGEEKDELREQVLALTAEVHALRVKVEFLEKENERLKNK